MKFLFSLCFCAFPPQFKDMRHRRIGDIKFCVCVCVCELCGPSCSSIPAPNREFVVLENGRMLKSNRNTCVSCIHWFVSNGIVCSL